MDPIAAAASARLEATSRRETQVTAGAFTYMADDPRTGQPGAGPTPTQLLLMALASCTAITLRAYADYKVDYAGDINVEVVQYEPRETTAEPYLQRTVTFSEPVSDSDFETMKEIMERTPVTLLVRLGWPIRTEITNG